MMITIHRVGALSLGKFLGILYAGLGLIAGLLMAGFTLLGMIFGGAYASTSDIGMMLAFVFVLPIIYGILGLIGGMITGLLCNLALRFAGGLELDAEITEKPGRS
jgi:hypothetical protein